MLVITFASEAFMQMFMSFTFKEQGLTSSLLYVWDDYIAKSFLSTTFYNFLVGFSFNRWSSIDDVIPCARVRQQIIKNWDIWDWKNLIKTKASNEKEHKIYFYL